MAIDEVDLKNELAGNLQEKTIREEEGKLPLASAGFDTGRQHAGTDFQCQ